MKKISNTELTWNTPEIFLAGIDGSGKSSVIRKLISSFEEKYRVLSMYEGEPHIFYKGTRQRALKKNFSKKLGKGKKRILEQYGLRKLLLPLNFLVNSLELRSIRKRKKFDIVIYETDRVLHPNAYGALHYPWIKIQSDEGRFNLFQRYFGPKGKYLTVYLDVDPETAVERILKRGEGVDAHENIADLQILKTEFDHLFRIAVDKDTNIVKLNTNMMSAASIANEISEILKEKFSLSPRF